jgi:hypothetical protein
MFAALPYNGFYGFFKFWARDHDKMTASLAFQAEIYAGSLYFPFKGTAGVLFFHAHYVA